ncbi:LLM class flavin-dependent oxidoreductase, partial [Staphylococcus gallinarum]
DAVYAVSWNLTQAKRYRERLKQALSQTAEPQRHIKVFPGLVTYVGQTKEEALAKKKRLDAQLPVKTALKQLSFFIQQDCQDWNL